MADVNFNCPRCGRIVTQGDASCEWCQLDLTNVKEQNPLFRKPLGPEVPPSVMCNNCHSVWPIATRMCPVCGHELYMPGCTPEGSWPPGIGEQPVKPAQSSPPLITGSVATDIATGVVVGLVGVFAALFTNFLSLLLPLLFFKYPYCRRGAYYGAGVAALVIMSAFLACNYVLRGL